MNKYDCKIFATILMRNKYLMYITSNGAKQINNERIIFDEHEMTLIEPTIFDNKSYKLSKYNRKNKQLCFSFYSNNEKIIGEYIFEKQNDTIYLIKQTT